MFEEKVTLLGTVLNWSFLSPRSWSETATRRQRESRSRSAAGQSPAPPQQSAHQPLPAVETGKGATALRMSLDQRRRAIEANRQRALREGDKAAADRHQAAFLALLHSSQVTAQACLNTYSCVLLFTHAPIGQRGKVTRTRARG